jgi:hypothetical protein
MSAKCQGVSLAIGDRLAVAAGEHFADVLDNL